MAGVAGQSHGIPIVLHGVWQYPNACRCFVCMLCNQNHAWQQKQQTKRYHQWELFRGVQSTAAEAAKQMVEDIADLRGPQWSGIAVYSRAAVASQQSPQLQRAGTQKPFMRALIRRTAERRKKLVCWSLKIWDVVCTGGSIRHCALPEHSRPCYSTASSSLNNCCRPDAG